jgi:hypothetical protein
VVEMFGKCNAGNLRERGPTGTSQLTEVLACLFQSTHFADLEAVSGLDIRLQIPPRREQVGLAGPATGSFAGRRYGA